MTNRRKAVPITRAQAIAFLDGFDGPIDSRSKNAGIVLLLRGVTKRVLTEVRGVLAAAEHGDLWAAVRYALSLDETSVYRRLLLDQYREQQALLQQAPDAERGRKWRAAAVAGGRARGRKLKGPSSEVLCAEAIAIHRRNPHLSRRDVCDRLGRKYSVSRRTVQRRVRAGLWCADLTDKKGTAAKEVSFDTAYSVCGRLAQTHTRARLSSVGARITQRAFHARRSKERAPLRPRARGRTAPRRQCAHTRAEEMVRRRTAIPRPRRAGETRSGGL